MWSQPFCKHVMVWNGQEPIVSENSLSGDVSKSLMQAVSRFERSGKNLRPDDLQKVNRLVHALAINWWTCHEECADEEAKRWEN